MIDIEDLHKSYSGTAVLQGVHLGVRQGEVIVLVGPSGSGKSTLLRCINGLEAFERGRIRVDGFLLEAGRQQGRSFRRMIGQVRRRVGMVFQSFNLFPHLTVLENLTLAPIKVLGRTRAQAEEKARGLLSRVNLKDKEKLYPGSLSGGEQQRVAIARALAMDLRVILFDEPTSSLDPELVGEVLAVIADLAGEGYTMMIVTHQMPFARRSADRMIFLDGGRILEDAPPEEFFERPRSERVRSFLSSLRI